MSRGRMLVAMTGLPGTGKSTLACRLAEALGGVILSKDVVRAALFPAPVLDYSREQDDIAMTAIYRAAASILRSEAPRPILLDGRTFTRSGQMAELLEIAGGLNVQAQVVECRCDDTIARERLARAGHLAGNRTFELYLRLKGESVPLTVPRLVVDTGDATPDDCVRLALEYLSLAH